MVANVTQFDDSDIDKIEFVGKELNDCDIIGTPNVSDDENENDPQNLKNEKYMTNRKYLQYWGKF